MSLLKKTTKGTKSLPRRICVYGTHGIGKSTFASMAPNPLVLDIEGGTADIEFFGRLEKADGLESFEDVLSVISDLLNEPHDFETLVIDSLDWLEQWIWDSVCQQHNVQSIEKVDGGFGKGYIVALTLWRELFAGLDALRVQRGMTIILLAHCRVARFESPEGSAYDRYEPKLQNGKNVSALGAALEWCDEVLFATYKVFVQTEENGFNKKRGIGVGSGERVLRCTERPAHIAKNRLGIPDEIPLDWDDFAAFVRGLTAQAS